MLGGWCKRPKADARRRRTPPRKAYGSGHSRFGPDPAIAVGLELIGDRLQLGDETVVRGPRGGGVAAGACQSHQRTPPAGGEPVGPVIADELALVRDPASSCTFFRNSSSSVCWPTSHSKRRSSPRRRRADRRRPRPGRARPPRPSRPRPGPGPDAATGRAAAQARTSTLRRGSRRPPDA